MLNSPCRVCVRSNTGSTSDKAIKREKEGNGMWGCGRVERSCGRRSAAGSGDASLSTTRRTHESCWW